MLASSLAVSNAPWCVEVNVVIAAEIVDPPPDQRPVEWILLTNVPLDSEVSGL